MRHERIFDFAWIDVEPAGDDHVAFAIDNIVKTICIAIADIAGVMPAKSARGGRRLFVLVVSRHDKIAAHDDLAALAVAKQSAVMGELRKPFSGVAAEVYEILTGDDEYPEDHDGS